jgi:hypothetical protein
VHELYRWPLAASLLISMLLALTASGLLRGALRTATAGEAGHA